MPLLRLTNVSIAFGIHAILKNADFQLDAGERVGLLGRNGEGKSTLMKIIAGNIQADHGDIWRQPELKLAWLEQTPDLPDDATIYDAVAGGLGELGEWITRYHALSMTMDYDDGFVAYLDGAELRRSNTTNGVGSVVAFNATTGGNSSRWINHSCAPNCEAVDDEDRIYIETLRAIRPGEELCYDYRIELEEKHTPEMKRLYQCRCGARRCKGTILHSRKNKKK